MNGLLLEPFVDVVAQSLLRRELRVENLHEEGFDVAAHFVVLNAELGVTHQADETGETHVIGIRLLIGVDESRQRSDRVRAGRRGPVAVGGSGFVDRAHRQRDVETARGITRVGGRVAIERAERFGDKGLLRVSGEGENVLFKLLSVFDEIASVGAYGPSREIVFAEEILNLSGVAASDNRRLLRGERIVDRRFLKLLREGGGRRQETARRSDKR